MIAVLQEVVNNNTQHYKTDFEIDKGTFVKASYAPFASETKFIWFSRPCGTNCYSERVAHCKDTYEYNSIIFHSELKESIIAFSVEITGSENGIVRGNLYEIDLQEYGQRLAENALEPHSVLLIFDGSSRYIPHSERWQAKYTDWQLKHYETLPSDLALWEKTLQKTEDERHNAKYDEWDLLKFKKHLVENNPYTKQRNSVFLDKQEPAPMFGIYQLKDECLHDIAFLSLEKLCSMGKTVQFDNYNFVYADYLEADFDESDGLEKMYIRFNVDRPQDFTGHSLSVSDVIVLKDNETYKTYYVDSTGFKQLKNFFTTIEKTKNQGTEM